MEILELSKLQLTHFRIQDGQIIRVNLVPNHIGKPAPRNVMKEIKALSENLRVAATTAILLVTDLLLTQNALPWKPNLTQSSQRLRNTLQTVPLHEPWDNHFFITDTFKEFLQKKYPRTNFVVIQIWCQFSKVLCFSFRAAHFNYRL